MICETCKNFIYIDDDFFNYHCECKFGIILNSNECNKYESESEEN